MQIQRLIIQKIELKQKDDVMIEERNWLVHQDIENEMKRRQNGLYCFGLRVVNGEITDYLPIDNAEHNLP
jgi:hypothetical protein